MNVAKLVGIIIGGVIALAVLAALAILLLVKPNDFRGDIGRLVEKETGRKLTIDGDLQLRFYPWLSLEASRVALGNPPGFGAEPFVAAKSLRIGVRIVPLLQKRLEASRLAVDGLEAHLVALADGRNNWQGLGQGGETTPAAGTGLRETSIAGLDVTHSSVIYRDAADNSLTRVRDLELHTGALGGANPVPLKIKLALDAGEGTAATRLDLGAKARWSGAGVVELTDLVLDGQREAAVNEKAGNPVTVGLRAARLVIDSRTETLERSDLEGKFGEVPFALRLGGEQLFGDRVLHGDFKVPVVDLRKAAPSLGVQLPAAREASTFGRFSATGGYRLTRKALALTALDWQLDDTRARGRLAVTDLDRMSLTFDLDVDHIDVDRYLAPVPPAVEGAGRPAAPPTPIPLAALRKLVARGELRIGQAKFKDLPLSAVRVPLDADRGLVRIGPAQARLLGGVYAGTTTLDARPAEARLSLDAHVRDIDLGALVKASFKSERFTGHGDANAKLTALGNTDAALFKSIAGRVDANARDGALVGRDLWYEIRRARALSRGAAPPEKTGPDRTQFRAMSGSATIADGIARSDDLTVDLQYLRAHGTGTLVIASQAIDYRLTAEVYNIPPEGSPGAEMADLKALAIPLTVTGTLSDYKVRPDFAGLVKAKVQQQVEAKKQELRQKAEEQIKDKLKGLFGG